MKTITMDYDEYVLELKSREMNTEDLRYSIEMLRDILRDFVAMDTKTNMPKCRNYESMTKSQIIRLINDSIKDSIGW